MNRSLSTFPGIASILLFSCLPAFAQSTKDITRIEFSSGTRGTHQQVTVTRDSIIVMKKELRSEEKTFYRKTTSKEWKRLIRTLGNVSLTEIPDLKSPTMKRAYDGAMHSNLMITTTSSNTFNHSFDDENPQEKMLPLLKAVLRLKEKAAGKK